MSGLWRRLGLAALLVVGCAGGPGAAQPSSTVVATPSGTAEATASESHTHASESPAASEAAGEDDGASLVDTLPEEMGGAAVDYTVVDGDELSESDLFSEESIAAFLTPLGKTIEDWHGVWGQSTTGTITAWQVDGVDGDELLAAILEPAGDDVSEAVVGGKTVSVIEESMGATYFYALEDGVFMITSDQETAYEFFRQLP